MVPGVGAGKVWDAAAAWLVRTCAFLVTLACILWNLDLPIRVGVAILTEQYLALVLGLSLCILFLTVNLAGQKPGRAAPLDFALALLGLGTLGYASVAYVGLLNEVAFRPPVLTFIGGVVVVLVMEGIRRGSGWVLFGIVAVFAAYALTAHLVPGPLVGRDTSLVQLVQYIGFDPSAVFGSPLTVGATVVVLFVFFGNLLFQAGGGEFFTDLSRAVTGRTRGGAAKISVVASALFGSISGSAVSNVATTGVITIPLMRKNGYSATEAGAIEAIASTGGQLTPPIMGAAAFLMAEFLEIPYMAVALAAIIPAALYYVSVFAQVHLLAAREGLAPTEAGGPTLVAVFRRGWHLVLPFAVLIYALFWLNMDPEDSALLSAAFIAVLGFLRPYGGHRLTLPILLGVFVATGTMMVELILIVASAGFVIGILNITGLGFALTLALVNAVGGNPVLVLLMAAAVCIVLGMGMPTSGVYVLLAALIAPAIVESGVEPLAAHMFILYFGMMSMITPPIALAAFAAAAISKADALMTGLVAVRMGWAAYVIPFVFVATPSLLLQADAGLVVLDCAKAVAGILMISAAVVGYFGRRFSRPVRLGVGLVGLACLPVASAPPAWAAVNLAAGAVALVTLGYLFVVGRRVAAA